MPERREVPPRDLVEMVMSFARSSWHVDGEVPDEITVEWLKQIEWDEWIKHYQNVLEWMWERLVEEAPEEFLRNFMVHKISAEDISKVWDREVIRWESVLQ
jgi:hypothetical protein